ncbi:MAG: virulence protein [Herminiimonas sp.]|nr:virulence protein [Herminiimonas sp.]
MKKYLTVAAGLAVGAMLISAAAPAMARVDVGVNIGVPGIYVQPAPVYVQPQPIYVQPRPIYVQPRPVYVQPGPVYVQPQPVYVERYHQHWREHQWHERQMRAQHDRDGDGVPNRYDRRPDNPYRY